jgi:hypothetical protein
MSWADKMRQARQRRAEILRDLRENGWPGMRRAVGVKAVKVRRVVAQAPGKAMASGKAMARKVVSVQRAAGLNRKLVERSAQSVILDQEPRHQSRGHTVWVAGYAAEIRERVPGVLPEPPKPREWFEVDPNPPEPAELEL